MPVNRLIRRLSRANPAFCTVYLPCAQGSSFRADATFRSSSHYVLQRIRPNSLRNSCEWFALALPPTPYERCMPAPSVGTRQHRSPAGPRPIGATGSRRTERAAQLRVEQVEEWSGVASRESSHPAMSRAILRTTLKRRWRRMAVSTWWPITVSMSVANS